MSGPISGLGLEAGARVVAAMSGGVDSSVVAALLQRQGFEVVGVTLQLYDHGAATGRKGACCAGQDIYDARRVADRLGIAHYVLDYESRFRRDVMEDFAASYAAGETPIPCVRCNQRVKFRDLLATARELGAAALATGHYARRLDGPDGAELHRGRDPERDQSYFLFATTAEQLAFLRFPLGDLEKRETRALAAELGLPVAEKPDSQDICFVPDGPELHRGREPERDQSYFLFATTAEQLDFLRFPLGDIEKRKTRALATELGLLVAEKPDSQDICFVPNGRYAGVVERLRPDASEPGEIVHVDGRMLGRHAGVIHFTIGQRRGIGIAGAEPLYVVRLNAARRQVVVGPRAALACAGVALREINWLAAPAAGERVEVKLRSASPAVSAVVAGDQVRFVEPQLGVAPGQACVVYRGARLLGGGFIAATAAAGQVAA